MVAALSLIAVVVAGMFASLLVTVRTLDATSKAGRATNVMTQDTLQLERVVVDLETGVRGYLLTNDSRFLEPYHNGRQRLDAKIAELTFDSVVDAIPVRGAVDVPRMLTFHAGGLTVDVELSAQGLMGQVLPPQPARIEVLGGPQQSALLTADAMGRFTSPSRVSGPFALRLRTGGEVLVTEWLRA
jgi:hypothetical protein